MCRLDMLHVACAHEALTLKHWDPETRNKALAPKWGRNDGKAQWFKVGNSSKEKMQMLWLLYCSAASPLYGKCLPAPISCQTGQPCLGWRGEKEALPWTWDVLSSS